MDDNNQELIYFVKPLYDIDLKIEPEVITSIIDQQWQDIHHSRNQDWLYWAILSAIVAGIMALIGNESSFDDNTILFLLNILFTSGIIISWWAEKISLSHWILHIKRLGYIRWLERFLIIKTIGGKKIPLSRPEYNGFDGKDKYVVNGLIYSMYLSIKWIFILFLTTSIIISGFVTFSTFNLGSVVVQKMQFCVPLVFIILGFVFLCHFHKTKSEEMQSLRDNYLKWLDKIA